MANTAPNSIATKKTSIPVLVDPDLHWQFRVALAKNREVGQRVLVDAIKTYVAAAGVETTPAAPKPKAKRRASAAVPQEPAIEVAAPVTIPPAQEAITDESLIPKALLNEDGSIGPNPFI